MEEVEREEGDGRLERREGGIFRGGVGRMRRLQGEERGELRKVGVMRERLEVRPSPRWRPGPGSALSD